MEISQQINRLLNEAIKTRASDIYFLPDGDDYLVKIRNQNEVIVWDKLGYLQARRMMNYCKYIADMALSEQRRPQIGSMDWNVGDDRYFLRLSSVGNFTGLESLVIRIIYQLKDVKTAFFNENQVQFISEMSRKRGLIVFSGPTGSGKTTTIYNLVKQMVTDQFVMTIEDPIEIKEPRFLQLQVNHDAGMDYTDLIKVGLRHRPDVFIVGEIRDAMTAEAAIKAALSGHLVYTTVHAQDPLGVIDRLKQLGISDEFISQALTGVAYQRLIPTVEGNQRAMLMAHEYFELEDLKKYDWSEWQGGLSTAVKDQLVTPTVAKKFELG
ncbi:competence type IV pilus ATPase ComGA [Lentilactobacillus otakiensis]|uniref:Type II secretion system protein E n=1 Tax=Lentilactobacillus otakiensis DSM 19908 = JCM 15040 TaxID=1423780 RepID=S4NB60_9LACO|nr:competence type IV pilus ATPase ComGA [Lentilactobacillus otakiensis]KRL09061.1 type II secretion system protein E [Lentilactobacillus otakiensis DSM 19908 = JCM 15040]MBZ3775675.1 Flp pilus assembly complex ATPase component TadA [Lentilactobacillus otakiensis]MDV3518894.1 competence type IV pilus ATPase ComGA [Lentilactobacillus otakiensis]GAD15944.1 type II secretion system protein E [Lentilactobacillus otakiensis DSM 19908 = JCM 15040]